MIREWYENVENNSLHSRIQDTALKNIDLINQEAHSLVPDTETAQLLANTGVQIANVESDLGNNMGYRDGKQADGLFQFLKDEFKTSLNRIVNRTTSDFNDAIKNNKIYLPDDQRKIAIELQENESLREQVRMGQGAGIYDSDLWQTRLAINNFYERYDGYPKLLSNNPRITLVVNQFELDGYQPSENFLQYAYITHNTEYEQIKPKFDFWKNTPHTVEKLNELSNEAGSKHRNSLSTKPLTVKDIVSQYTGSNGKEIAELYVKRSYVNPKNFNLSENTLKAGYGSHHHMELTHQIYELQPPHQKDINLAAYQAKELIQKDSLSYLQGQSKFRGFPIIDAQAKSVITAEVGTIVEKLDVEKTPDISTAINGLNKTLSTVNLSYDDLKNHLNEGTKIQDIPEIKAYDLAKNPQKQNIFTKLFSSSKETPISDYTDRIIRQYNKIEKSIEVKKQTLTGKIDHFKNEISHINMSDETNQIINSVNTSSSTYLQGHLNVSLLSKMQENPEQILMEFNESQNSMIKASSYLLPSGSQQKTVDTFLEKNNQTLSNTIKENLSRVTSDLPQTQTNLNQSLQSLSQSPASMVHKYEYSQKLELQQILDENVSESSSISM